MAGNTALCTQWSHLILWGLQETSCSSQTLYKAMLQGLCEAPGGLWSCINVPGASQCFSSRVFQSPWKFQDALQLPSTSRHFTKVLGASRAFMKPPSALKSSGVSRSFSKPLLYRCYMRPECFKGLCKLQGVLHSQLGIQSPLQRPH